MPTPTDPRPPTRQERELADDPPPAAAVRFLLRMRDVPQRFRDFTDAHAAAVLAPVRRKP
jgi:hypothetical protein